MGNRKNDIYFMIDDKAKNVYKVTKINGQIYDMLPESHKKWFSKNPAKQSYNFIVVDNDGFTSTIPIGTGLGVQNNNEYPSYSSSRDVKRNYLMTRTVDLLHYMENNLDYVNYSTPHPAIYNNHTILNQGYYFDGRLYPDINDLLAYLIAMDSIENTHQNTVIAD